MITIKDVLDKMINNDVTTDDLQKEFPDESLADIQAVLSKANAMLDGYCNALEEGIKHGYFGLGSETVDNGEVTWWSTKEYFAPPSEVCVVWGNGSKVKLDVILGNGVKLKVKKLLESHANNPAIIQAKKACEDYVASWRSSPWAHD